MLNHSQIREDNTRIDVREGVDWIYLAHYRNR